MNLKTKYTIPSYVMIQKVNDDTIVLNTTNGLFFALNPMGEVIWNLMYKSASLQEVHDKMLEMFDVSSQQLEADIITFCNTMIEQELLVLKS